MTNALAYLFLIGAVISLLAAALSLITPRVAFFLRKKTRLRGLLAWFGISCLCFLCMAAFAPRDKQTSAAVEQKAVPAPAEATTVAPSPGNPVAKPEQTPPATKPQLVAYREAEVADTSVSNRKRGEVRIVLADPAADFTAEQLAATCMAAAKFYAREYGFQALSVFFADIPGDKPWEGTQIARCAYSPDKGGWSGSQGWLWDEVKAVDRPLTGEERQMKKLWGQLRGKAHGEAELKKAVAQKMKITPEKVTLLYVFPENVASRNLENVEPQGPVK